MNTFKKEENMKNIIKSITLGLIAIPLYVQAGGNPDHVKFPQDYEKNFKQYATMNRANQTQVAKLYANETAVNSFAKDSKSTSGSIVVMEIYNTKKNAEGQPVVGKDGLFEIDSLAAVGVMENRNNWDASFNKEDRTENWGFAVFNPDGTAKSNDLNCVQCHTPLKAQDYMFTYQKLVEFTKK